MLSPRRKKNIYCTEEYKKYTCSTISELSSLSLFRYGTAELCFHHVLLIAHLVSGVCWECDLFCVLVVFWKLVWDDGPQGTLFLSYTQTKLTIGVK